MNSSTTLLYAMLAAPVSVLAADRPVAADAGAEPVREPLGSRA